MRRNDEKYMQRAIELAKKGEGKTFPNPCVGAVVVKGGEILGEGFHDKAGSPHAEIHALTQAGRRAEGALLYVTLEPCCHTGRTPPCTEAILKRGIKEIIIGAIDPNPVVNGKGIEAVRAAGIAVQSGVLQPECEALIKSYAHRLRYGIPLVTAKIAVTLDGKMATSSGESQWITGEACRRYIHELRDRADAILVGRKTVEVDDPSLNARLETHTANKLAVVVDSALQSPATATLFQRAPGEVLIATTQKASSSARAAAQRMGHELLFCHADEKGRVALPHLLQLLGERGINALLLETGGTLLASFFREKLIHRAVVCIAPKFLGGAAADVFPGIMIPSLKQAPKLEKPLIQTFDRDVVIEGDVVWPS